MLVVEKVLAKDWFLMLVLLIKVVVSIVMIIHWKPYFDLLARHGLSFWDSLNNLDILFVLVTRNASTLLQSWLSLVMVELHSISSTNSSK